MAGEQRSVQDRRVTDPGDDDTALRLQKAYSAPTVGILSFRLDGLIIDANGALQQMSGYTADELREVGWEALTAPEFKDVTLAAADELATRGETAPYEKQWIRPDGTRWWGLFAPTRLHGEGRDTECLEFIIDITERKDAEARARAERQKLHDIFQQAPMPICIVEGPEYTFTYANPPYLALHARTDLVGMRLADALPKIAEEFTPILDRVIETGEPFVGTDYPIQLAHRALGDLVYMNFVYTPLRDPDGRIRGVLACGSDTTPQALARQALEVERELRERFVATLSHDLRTPLSTARMGADLIARFSGEAESRHRAERIMKNIDRADGMLQDLLDASRIKAGEGITLEMSHCSLAHVADDAVRDLAALHGDRFVLRTDDELVGYWSCTGVRRIIENLGSNAVKYGALGAPVTVTLSAVDRTAKLSVHNHGNPIPADELPTLFEPFRRTTSAQVAGEKGWGLGLTLVRGVAEAHGGHVHVTSTPAAGTTFTVTLPRRDAP